MTTLPPWLVTLINDLEPETLALLQQLIANITGQTVPPKA